MSRNLVPIIAVSASMASLGLIFGLSGYGTDPGVDAAQTVPAAEFSLRDLEGIAVRSEELRGQVVVVDIWATWCGLCLGEIPEFNALHADLQSRGVEIVGVAVQSGEADSVRAFVRSERYRVDYPVVLGSADFEAKFGPVWGLPTTLVIDRDWRIRQRWVGSVPDKHEQIRALVDELLATD